MTPFVRTRLKAVEIRQKVGCRDMFEIQPLVPGCPLLPILWGWGWKRSDHLLVGVFGPGAFGLGL